MTNRCDVCHGYEVVTVQGPADQKFRCTDCSRFLERLHRNDRQFLKSLRIAC